MGTMGTAAVFWTAHVTSGNEDQVSLYDNTREVQITALVGDCYVSPNALTHPPALDAMSTSDHWDGAIVLEGQTRVLKLRDCDVPDNVLYVGPVTPSSGACTLSVIATVN
jgi:hypothetical protein